MSINIVAMINSSAVNEGTEVKKVSCLHLLENATEERQKRLKQVRLQFIIITQSYLNGK